MAELESGQVWREIERRLFAVLGMVTPAGEARTAGIVYIVRDRKLYIGTGHDTWKARWIRQNGNVSLTVTIAKRIPFVPWIQIPAATITFSGEAKVRPMKEAPEGVGEALFRGLDLDPEDERFCVIEIEPRGHFVTYGVGVPLRTMRETEKARGRVAV